MSPRETMPKVLICYYSRSGNTKKMAYMIQKGIMAEDVEVDTQDVKSVKVDDLLTYDGIIMGSPTYYGGMAYQVKELLDKSVKHHGKLEGKVGGAFTSSANVGGGNETTIMAILQAMLIHGMVVQGDHTKDHYGPVAIDSPKKDVEKFCIRYGTRFAQLVKTLHG